MRRRLFLTQGSFLMSYLLGCPWPAALELSDAGWVHETTRFLMRVKLTLPDNHVHFATNT